MFVRDFIQNGRAHGEVASRLTEEYHSDPGLARPYYDKKGRRCVTLNTGRTKTVKAAGNRGLITQNGIPVQFPIYKKILVQEAVERGLIDNATTLLRKDEWVQLDAIVLRAARLRMRAWTDLAASNTYGGFDGMSRLVLEYETMSDPGEAFVDMDGMTEGRNDAPAYGLQGLPLPITHSDFWFSSRKLAVTRRGSTPIDSVMAEAAGDKIGVRVEKTTIGLETGMDIGPDPGTRYTNSTKVYGYLNFPQRMTKTNLTVPLGTNPEATIRDVIAMREQMYAARFFGPFIIYHSTDWDAYLDQDYYIAGSGGTVSGGNKTLRERIEAIDGISAVRRLDHLTSTSNPLTLLMIDQSSKVARAINGMNITTVQWPSMGGMRLNYKVMCIHVPQLFFNNEGTTGILQATTS